MFGHFLVVLGMVFAAGLGLPVPFLVPDQAIGWAPSAVALAGALMLGPRTSAAIFVGAVAGFWWHGIDLTAAAGLALGQVLASVSGAWLIEQLARGPHAFERGGHVLLYAGITALVSSTLGSLTVVGVLAGTAPVEMAVLEKAALSWWWANTTSCLLVAPALILWSLRPRFALGRRRGDRRPRERGLRAGTHPRAREASALGVITVAAALAIFGPWLSAPARLLCAVLTPFPLLAWSAMRFGARETATVVLVLAVAGVWAWLHGVNPFDPVDPSLRVVQLTLIGPALTALVLAASIDRRNREDSEMHLLAVTDPLTGLANYRHLTDSIDRQIRRTQQTGEVFALLLLDVDNLKVINDQLGHNVGSRLLVRLADALRACCRVTDLIARYGGDEFAVLLPGCDEKAARIQAARIQAALEADATTPPIAASMGVAVFPRDGDTADQLLDRADDELYAMKGRRSRQQ